MEKQYTNTGSNFPEQGRPQYVEVMTQKWWPKSDDPKVMTQKWWPKGDDPTVITQRWLPKGDDPKVMTQRWLPKDNDPKETLAGHFSNNAIPTG